MPKERRWWDAPDQSLEPPEPEPRPLGEVQVRATLFRPGHHARPVMSMTLWVDFGDIVEIDSPEAAETVLEAVKDALGSPLSQDWVLDDWGIFYGGV